MDEDFIWDLINTLNNSGEIELRKDFDDIRF